MPPAPLELALPEDLADREVLELLRAQLDVADRGVRTEERVLLDSFDGRLRAAGLTAELAEDGRDRGTLVLLEEGAPARKVPAAPAARLLAGDLEPGPVREALAGIIEERALLPRARVRRRLRSVAVLNADAKTVVRLELERASAGTEAGRVELPARLRARPVRGYDGAFARTARVLTDVLGMAPAATPASDAAVAAAGGRPEGVSSKVAVALERGMRADVAAGLVLARLAEIAADNVAGTLDDLDPEFLHDLRVSVRRARSVLRELPGVHASAERAHLRAELKWIQQITGPVRDLDVQLLEWDAFTGRLASERGADLAPLRDLLQRRRARALRDLRRGLRTKRFRAALAAWGALASAPPADDPDDRPDAGAPIEALAASRIRSVHRRMVRDGSAIRDDSPDEALHDLRKRGKELRYLLEFFGTLFGDDVVRPMVRSLKDLQSVLGRFQDRAVQVAVLRGLGDELATSAGGPAALMALGLVLDALERDQHEARAQFRERFDAFAAPEQRKLVKRTFAEPAPA